MTADVQNSYDVISAFEELDIKNSKSNMTKGSDIDYIRLKKLMHINDERLSIHELRNKKLVKGNIQGAVKSLNNRGYLNILMM